MSHTQKLYSMIFNQVNLFLYSYYSCFYNKKNLALFEVFNFLPDNKFIFKNCTIFGSEISSCFMNIDNINRIIITLPFISLWVNNILSIFLCFLTIKEQRNWAHISDIMVPLYVSSHSKSCLFKAVTSISFHILHILSYTDYVVIHNSSLRRKR